MPWLIADLKSIPQKAGKIMGVSLLQDLGELAMKRKQFGFFEDFETFVTGDLFTDTSADSGATIAVGDAAGGVNVLTTGATDNNEAYLLTTKELFKFAANKPLLFEARIQYAEANTDDANVCLGFMDAVGANSILDDGAGPKASTPRSCRARTAGPMISISSRPRAPPSPACGLRPAKASRGAVMPKLRHRPRAVARPLATTKSIDNIPGTAETGIWVVIGTTRRPGPASIITAFSPAIPHRSATNSVCPG